MNPDEIQHFMFSTNYAYNEEQLKTLDDNVLQILKDYKWFHFIGVGPGWERTEKIKDIYFLHYFTREKHSLSKTYFHFIYGKILKYSGIKDPLYAFYFFRLLSFLIYLVIFLLSLFFYKKYFPTLWIYMILGHLLIFQLATILNSVNYDVLLTLLGVLFFIFSYRFMVYDKKKEIFIIVLISGLAALIKTAGLLFFFYFLILLLFKYRINLVFFKKFLLALFLFFIIFSWLNFWFPERFFALYTIIFAKLRIFSNALATDSALPGLGFFNSILDSFFFHTGWMAFKLKSTWYLVLKIFLLFSIIGIIVSIYGKKLNDGAIEKKWIVYALVVFLIQFLSIRFYHSSDQLSQGRYLYPLIIPIITFIYCGMNYLEKILSLKRNYLMISYVIFQVIFLIFSLTRIISVFYLEIASPHAGL